MSKFGDKYKPVPKQQKKTMMEREAEKKAYFARLKDKPRELWTLHDFRCEFERDTKLGQKNYKKKCLVRGCTAWFVPKNLYHQKCPECREKQLIESALLTEDANSIAPAQMS